MFTNAEIRQSQELRSSAWADFKMKYPNADLSRFEVNIYFNKNKAASTEIVFKNSNGVETSVTGSNRKYWSHELKTALGIGGFPIELTLNSNSTKTYSRS